MWLNFSQIHFSWRYFRQSESKVMTPLPSKVTVITRLVCLIFSFFFYVLPTKHDSWGILDVLILLVMYLWWKFYTIAQHTSQAMIIHVLWWPWASDYTRKWVWDLRRWEIYLLKAYLRQEYKRRKRERHRPWRCCSTKMNVCDREKGQQARGKPIEMFEARIFCQSLSNL